MNNAKNFPFLSLVNIDNTCPAGMDADKWQAIADLRNEAASLKITVYAIEKEMNAGLAAIKNGNRAKALKHEAKAHELTALVINTHTSFPKAHPMVMRFWATLANALGMFETAAV
mgnify:CR=1 FL=1